MKNILKFKEKDLILNRLLEFKIVRNDFRA